MLKIKLIENNKDNLFDIDLIRGDKIIFCRELSTKLKVRMINFRLFGILIRKG